MFSIEGNDHAFPVEQSKVFQERYNGCAQHGMIAFVKEP